MISVLYSIPKEEFLEKLNESVSIRDFFNKINFPDVGRNKKTFYKIIKEYGFDKELEELKERTKIFLSEKAKQPLHNKKLSDEQVFCEHSKYNKYNLKRRIIKNNLLKYKCGCCGITEYNGKPIVLQLHHINGFSDDNRLENLIFLCPNCHSQTDNYSGKNVNFLQRQEKKEQNRIKKILKEKEIGELIKERRKSLDNINLFKRGWVSKVAKEWKVSRTQVKRWIKKYYPDLEYLDLEPTSIGLMTDEERIKFVDGLDKSEKNWLSKAAKEWNISLEGARTWFRKKYPGYKLYKKKQKNIDKKDIN